MPACSSDSGAACNCRRAHLNTRVLTAVLRAPSQLWGENFFDPATKKWTKKMTDSKTCMRGFVQFCYNPIKQVRGRSAPGWSSGSCARPVDMEHVCWAPYACVSATMP